ncbi:MAG TPA: ABC-2 family transporter protein, partial [Chloroflexota bacterium]
LLYLLSLVLGYLVSVLIGLVIGLVSFWTLQTWGVLAIYQYVSQFFTGALVPLVFFPAWLRRVADLLPFQAQAFIPLSLYMGNVAPKAIPGALGIQLV